MKKNKKSTLIISILLSIWVLQSCESDECTRIDTIGGSLLPEQQIEVPCDFPEPEPLGVTSTINSN
ncbi:hypothetical protein D7030_02955 [Flavobacteriaceae bacterium AU392]|nr:hypothetical protein D1817_09430 [Flavobacteriaceae bacterium]RKM85645.1 hypothetical protein D7030_02955 [Flavobacteriaceae bacterium AU392]